MYALVDCNNFFVSCERAINPQLEGKPVVILSNNDGCIVSRSNEVKALSIPMGAPYFKWKEYLESHHVRVFSSNYLLYGDMSGRVMETLETCLPDVHVYSIDEAFADVSGIHNLEQVIEETKRIVTQWTGIPVSIGVAPTKTLAKAANELAKKHAEHNGMLIFHTAKEASSYFPKIPVQDLWGVGRAFGEKLPRLGIHTAADLLQKDDAWIKKELGTPGVALVDELRGYERTTLDHHRDMRKSVIRSRSFGTRVTEKQDILDALTYFADRAAQMLRKEGLRAGVIRPFFMTSRFAKTRYYASKTIQLEEATNDSRILIQKAVEVGEQLFKPGYPYAKAGIVCTDIFDNNHFQKSLFSDERAEDARIMKAYDAIKKKFGPYSINLGRTSEQKNWHMKRNLLSTPERKNISSVPIAFCK